MQKFDKPCISTGDFARLCNTNKRTLFHYDEIGLFHPARTDEKGYRYYSESQCDVFFTITCLKDIGMPLGEIREFIVNRDAQKLKKLLERQKLRVEEELAHLHRIRQVIRTKYELVKEGEGLCFEDGCTAPGLQFFEEEYLAATPRLDTGDHQQLFTALCRHIGQVNREKLNTGHPYGAMISVRDIREGREDQYAYFFTKTAAGPKSGGLVKPKGRYAAIYLQGDYYDAGSAFAKLLSYIDELDLETGPFCYKEAVWDELTVCEKQSYITRISIPVYSRISPTLENTTSALRATNSPT